MYAPLILVDQELLLLAFALCGVIVCAVHMIMDCKVNINTSEVLEYQ